MPKFISSIAPGGSDDRIKGALHSLNLQVFSEGFWFIPWHNLKQRLPVLAKYALQEPTFRVDLLKAVFACQAYTDVCVFNTSQALRD